LPLKRRILMLASTIRAFRTRRYSQDCAPPTLSGALSRDEYMVPWFNPAPAIGWMRLQAG
jgi:hypothetical protein